MCQLRVFLAVLIGANASYMLARHFNLPTAQFGMIGLGIGWLAGNVLNFWIRRVQGVC